MYMQFHKFAEENVSKCLNVSVHTEFYACGPRCPVLTLATVCAIVIFTLKKIALKKTFMLQYSSHQKEMGLGK